MRATPDFHGMKSQAAKGRGRFETREHSFSYAAAKGRKPSAAQFSRLGFDRISTAQGAICLRKAQSHDILGKPRLFIEIEFRNNRAAIRYSCPPESDCGIRGLQACLLLMQAAYLLPGAHFESKSLSEFLLPHLECASRIALQPYESLSKKHADMSDELGEISSQNRRLLRAVEQSASECLALEERAAGLSRRVAQLERVPDAALDELLLDWLSSHKGALNFALFSQANGIAVARCEERLSALLEKGVLRKASGAFLPVGGAALPRAEFQLGKSGFSRLKRLILGRG